MRRPSRRGRPASSTCPAPRRHMGTLPMGMWMGSCKSHAWARRCIMRCSRTPIGLRRNRARRLSRSNGERAALGWTPRPGEACAIYWEPVLEADGVPWSGGVRARLPRRMPRRACSACARWAVLPALRSRWEWLAPAVGMPSRALRPVLARIRLPTSTQSVGWPYGVCGVLAGSGGGRDPVAGCLGRLGVWRRASGTRPPAGPYTDDRGSHGPGGRCTAGRHRRVRPSPGFLADWRGGVRRG